MNNLAPLQVTAGIRIAKPALSVFNAIVDPAQMCNYFIAKSTGHMEEGATLTWTFPEMEAGFPVTVKKRVNASLIIFSWGDEDGQETTVTITLTPVSDAITFVRITEGEKKADESGIRWLKGNTEGWANFLACLKAWMEFGINLRQGAIDPSQLPAQ